MVSSKKSENRSHSDPSDGYSNEQQVSIQSVVKNAYHKDALNSPLPFESLLPRFYTQILPEEILKLPIQESVATCHDCVEVPKYQPDLKCCTFHPFLPNYLVGQILEDQKSAPSFVTEVLQHKISKQEYVLPLGAVAPVKYQVEFNKYREAQFGQDPDWLCPYYDKKKSMCGIWRNRGSVCTTFYCHSSQGDEGKEFWRVALDYLSYVEMALAEEALVHLDFSPRQISDQLEYLNRHRGTRQELRSNSLEMKKAKALWNGYFDDQEVFYIKSLEIVKGFDKNQLAETMGELGVGITQQLLKAGRIWTR